MQHVAQENDIEGSITIGDCLSRSLLELRPWHEPAGHLQQVAVGLDLRDRKPPRYERLCEDSGTCAYIQHAGCDQTLDAQRDNPVDLRRAILSADRRRSTSP